VYLQFLRQEATF